MVSISWSIEVWVDILEAWGAVGGLVGLQIGGLGREVYLDGSGVWCCDVCVQELEDV